MRYIFNAFTEELEAPDNPSPLYENLGKRFNLAGGGLARQPFAPDNRDRVAYRKQYYDTYEKRPRVPGSIEGGRTSPVDSINTQVRT